MMLHSCKYYSALNIKLVQNSSVNGPKKIVVYKDNHHSLHSVSAKIEVVCSDDHPTDECENDDGLKDRF